MKVRQPDCYSCGNYLPYNKSFPTKAMGLTMHQGECFCTHGKKARRFKRRDPKSKVPAWCPMRKEPCEVRLYGFKSIEDWMLFEQLCRDLNKELSPESWRYALEYEGHTETKASELLERAETESEEALLGVYVPLHYVVEIDDGIRPACFFKTAGGLKYEPFFNTELARKNIKVGEEELA